MLGKGSPAIGRQGTEGVPCLLASSQLGKKCFLPGNAHYSEVVVQEHPLRLQETPKQGFFLNLLQGRFSHTIPVIALMPPEMGIRFLVSASQILTKEKRTLLKIQVAKPTFEAYLVIVRSHWLNQVFRLVHIHRRNISAHLIMQGSKLALSSLLVNAINGMRAQDSKVNGNISTTLYISKFL